MKVQPAPRRRGRALAIGLVAVAGALAGCPFDRDRTGSLPALASDAAEPSGDVAPCSARYPLVASLTVEPDTRSSRIDRALEDQAVSLDRVWGLDENATAVRGDDGSGVLEIRYPKGSINPSSDDDHPLGGAGFMAALTDRGLERACLRYRVRFDDGFDFRRGGKLPGLYGGEGPSGGEPVDGRNGFSARLMWREAGAGEVYAYVANKRDKYGASIGRGNWRFSPGHWTTVEIEVVLNHPERADGLVRVWVGGDAVVEQSDLVYRTVPSGRVDGLMFSTFFGGSGDDWASPRDQRARFAGFQLFGET